jgi:hypothetical protein
MVMHRLVDPLSVGTLALLGGDLARRRQPADIDWKAFIAETKAARDLLPRHWLRWLTPDSFIIETWLDGLVAGMVWTIQDTNGAVQWAYAYDPKNTRYQNGVAATAMEAAVACQKGPGG